MREEKRRGESNVTRYAVRFRRGDRGEFGIPGIAVGVWADGREAYALRRSPV
jgi:hypothetical protein